MRVIQKRITISDLSGLLQIDRKKGYHLVIKHL